MRTRITAALAAVLALLVWVAGCAPAGADAAGTAASGSSAGIQAAAIAGGVVLIFGLLLLAVRPRTRGEGGGPRTRGGGQRPAPAAAELEARASHALVATDDAIRTSEQELSFAVARFGEHATAPFSAAVKAAQAELAAAFELRQLLDDDIPATEPVTRKVLAEISGHCAEANRLLDEQAEAFDQLKDLEMRSAEVLPEVDHHVSQQDARVTRSEQTLGQLAAKYTADAVAIVANSPEQARQRLDVARAGLSDARQALAADDSDQAAAFLQAAELAADQAESLLDGIEHLEAELTQASSALPAALREIDTDIAEATALLAGQPDDRAAAVARAQVAASSARGQLGGGPFDPLAALRQLEEADTGLDQALASARAEPVRQERASAVLDQAMLVARSSVTAAEDFITTRRGGIGAAARTRLAEAHRHFQQAIASAQVNPEAAVTEAQHADALGRRAWSLAQQDVAQFSYRQQDPMVTAGGLGGGLSGAPRRASQSGN